MVSSKLVFLFVLGSWLAQAQSVQSFEGIDALQLGRRQHDVDPNGAVGNKQYMEWVNNFFQAYDKTTFAPVWSLPVPGTQPFQENKLLKCTNVGGDGIITFDHLALRWVIAVRSTSAPNTYYY